jgi:hypothetical protein
MQLANELTAAGYAYDASAFKDLVAELFHGMYRDLTVDDLVLEPDMAKAYCCTVRMQAKLPSLADGVILRALMNIRKRGVGAKKMEGGALYDRA